MTQDNPSAFPSRVDKPFLGGGSYRDDRPGMTLRDYFAGQALAGMLANNDHLLMIAAACREVGETDGHAAVAGGAYDYADAMLAARSNDMEGEGRDNG